MAFAGSEKEQVLEYAAMTGDDYEIRKMVRDLADAVRSSDEEKVDEILWNAREKIDSFPDRSVGMSELKGYGYTADDMFPLRQEMALELHRVGEKVYCLQSDGSHGDYASREMILEHEGLYGIEKDELIYSDKMLYGDTLDSLYEKFNIAHPADYTGHSLSVSDIVVLNENGNVKAYFVDSISFRELPFCKYFLCGVNGI